ncbi:MAG: PQQ-binding-like beta-propeller repeat protein [Planctomycetaceae bacterium]|nr:PQQ-binding-like beta-propeller repeat protein [Planctomycetaceae bacterium]
MICLTATMAAASGGDPNPWSRWRGADGAGQGGGTRFPVTWAESDWAWTAALPGAGNASPVVLDGRIYTASADEAAGRRFVTAHALADGKLLWTRALPGPIERHHAQNSSASGSVAADARGVYWVWGTRDGVRVEAFSHAGEPRWHVDLGGYEGEHGFGTTPAVCRDLLVVSIDQEGKSAIVAVDAATGAERWRLPRESAKAGYATPLVVDGAATASPPILAGPLVIGTSGDGGGDNLLAAVRPPAGAGAEPEIAYTLDRSIAPYVPTPLVVDEFMYLWGDRGVVTCVRAATGETVWRGRVGGTYSASPIAVGDTIRNVSADGEAVAIRRGDSFEVLGRVPLGETCRATPAIVGDRMVFRTAGRLLALDAAP